MIYMIYVLLEMTYEYAKTVNKRHKQFGNRKIDRSKSLFDRNIDIIQKHSKKITDTSSSRNVEILIHQCLNEICLAENEILKYLYYDRIYRDVKYAKLASRVKEYFEQTKLHFKE